MSRTVLCTCGVGEGGDHHAAGCPLHIEGCWICRSTQPREGSTTQPKEGSTEGDMKASLNSAVKPDLSHVRSGVATYIARACGYGSSKYERANYLRPTSGRPADVARLRAYLAAVLRHLLAATDALERADATGADPVATFATQAPDAESGLPHVAHAAAGLMMLIEQAIAAGLLPADPGTPWVRP